MPLYYYFPLGVPPGAVLVPFSTPGSGITTTAASFLLLVLDVKAFP